MVGPMALDHRMWVRLLLPEPSFSAKKGMIMILYLTDENFDSVIQSEGRIIVEWTASWCPPCRAMNPVLEALAAEGSIMIGKIDVDKNPVTTRRFSVMAMPTFAAFESGRMVNKAVGIRTKDQLKALGGW